jgi:cell division protein FtsW
VLVAAVALLCGFGLIMVYSASSVLSVEQTGSSWSIVTRQGLWLVIGVGVAVVASRIPLEVWRDRLIEPMLVLAVLPLAWIAADVVLRRVAGIELPLVAEVNGASRWLAVGPVQFQPSELAKPALVLWLARVLSDRRRDLGSWHGLKPVLLVAGMVMALVIAGDDLGTTMLVGVVLLVMLWMAGAPVRTVGALGGSFVLVAFGVIRFLQGFRASRITAFLNPEDPMVRAGAGMQLYQSQIGLASGGLFGSGPGYSRAKWGFLPEAHTDFILSVIGEEFGLVGSLVVVGLFLAVMGAGCAIALRSRTMFGRLVAFGITTWLGFQALINIGVTVGTLPTKGITLPFVSYGGSSMFASLVAVGLLQNVHMRRYT